MFLFVPLHRYQSLKNSNMREETFIAVDFETATPDRMACQVGITFVRDGIIEDTIIRLIQPPGNLYSPMCMKVHHINPEMTKDSPTFEELWKELSPCFTNTTIVAHNAAFDEDVLYKNLDYYGILPMGLEKFKCTYRLFDRSLADLCAGFGMECSGHHDAGFDSRCCAQFYLNFLHGVHPDESLMPEKKKKPVRERKARKEYDDMDDDVFSEKDLLNMALADTNHPFYRKNVCYTGVFNNFSRDFVRAYLNVTGAKFKATISKNLHYVIIGSNPGERKIEQLEKLAFNGFHIRQLKEDDLVRIVNDRSCWDEYRTERLPEKELRLTYEHYQKFHLQFEGLQNLISSKELYFGKGLRERADCFYQMTGNLGAFGNWELCPEVQICVLSNQTLSRLKTGEEDETVKYIQDYYNSHRTITFDYQFLSEQDILDYVLKRCEAFDDDITLALYNRYLE